MTLNSRQSQPPKANLKGIVSIKDLQVIFDEQLQVYPRAYALPQFLTKNLLDEKRVIKFFNSDNAVIDAFAFQFMKLALQIQVQNKSYLECAKQIFVKGKDGLIGQLGELQDQYLSDFQYRKFFQDFTDIVENLSFPDFQGTAKKYPIIKEILRKFFNKLVPISLFLPDEQSQITSDFDIVGEIFVYLGNVFGIQLNLAGECYKFKELDMFVYVQSLTQIYVAYVEEDNPKKNHFAQSNTSSFVCAQGNLFTSKLKNKKNRLSQNSFKIKKNTLQYMANNDIQTQQTQQNLIQSKVLQDLSHKISNCEKGTLNISNFPIQRRSQNGLKNSRSAKQSQMDINTIIDILQNRELENKFEPVEIIEIRSSSKIQNIDDQKNTLQSRWQEKYKIQQIQQLKEQQQVTQNTIKSTNKLGQSHSFLTAAMNQDKKKIKIPKISLNSRLSRERLSEIQYLTDNSHQKQNYFTYSLIQPKIFEYQPKSRQINQSNNLKSIKPQSNEINKAGLNILKNQVSGYSKDLKNLKIENQCMNKDILNISTAEDNQDCYKQFTQSRILDLLEPEYRIKIKQIKNKFKEEIKKQKISFVSVSGSRSKSRMKNLQKKRTDELNH